MNAAANPQQDQASPPATATSIAEYSPVAAAIATLKQDLGAIVYDFSKPGEMQRALKDRARVRTYRLDLEKVRVEIKAPALERCNAIDTEARRIKGELESIEDPIDAQIKKEEQRKEDERLAREKAEADRVAGLHARIAEINARATDAVGLPSVEVARCLDFVRQLSIDGTFGEFRETAEAAKRKAVATLEQLHAGAVATEQAAERVRQAKIEEEERLERQREEFRREQEAEEARQAAEQQRLVAEHKRLAEERAKAEAAERERRAAIEREELQARERREAEERAHRAKLEAEERAAREKREREEELARAAREAAQRKADEEAAARRRESEAEEERLRFERARLEEEQREVARRAADLQDGRTILAKFRERFAGEREFAGVVRAIDVYLAAGNKPAKAAA